MSGDATSRQLANLGKGLIQVNLRLNRILEVLASSTGGATISIVRRYIENQRHPGRDSPST